MTAGAELAAALLDDGFLSRDPHPHFTRLRAEAPVVRNADPRFWVFSTYADVARAARDPATFCSSRGILLSEIGVTYDAPPTIMHTDPPAHTRYRKLVQPGFAPAVMRQVEPSVRGRAHALVDRLPRGEAVDIVANLAVPYPLQVISDLLGVPDEDWPQLYEWSEAVIPGATDWPEDKRMALLGDMTTSLLDAAHRRRADPRDSRDPRDDIISTLAAVEIDGEQLDDGELAMFLIQLLVAGNETTRNLLSAGLVALAERPDQWARLREDRTLLPTAVEELLRWTTPVVYFMRTATRRVELRGETIAAGDPVVLLYASANRDETEFGPTAGELDVGRSPNHHLAFGSGPHHCIGAALARLEAAAALDALLNRFPVIEPAGPIERSASLVIAGIKHAPLRFEAFSTH